ncbi:hypothetical protein [Streptomyces sp. NPDC054975]
MSELYADGETDVEETTRPETPELPAADDSDEPLAPVDDDEVGDGEGDLEDGDDPDTAEPDAPAEPDGLDESDESDESDDGMEARSEDVEPLESDETEAETDDAEGISETDAKIAELEKQGHGPQRHLHPTTEALKDRTGEPKTDANDDVVIKNNGHVRTINHVNPETGTTQEPTADGGTKPHFCGDYATKFSNPEDYVRAEEYLRAKALESGDPKVEASIEDIFGPGDHSDRFEGYYVDPSDPQAADDSVNHLPVDFQDGSIFAVYDRGTGDLKTMYPSPEPGRHP